MYIDKSATSTKLHKNLPISPDEKVLAVFRHHWMAYAVIWATGLVAVLIVLISGLQFANSLVDSEGAFSPYREAVLIGSGLFAAIIGLATLIPIIMRAGEQLVVTDEAVFQVLQPSVFNSKVSQLGLQHVNDVSVRKDFFGTIFGYGTVTIETPGEQANYHFRATERPDDAVRVIVEAHENFSAALESGRLPTTLNKVGQDDHTVNIDAAEYKRFLDFQQYEARAQAERDTVNDQAKQ